MIYADSTTREDRSTGSPLPVMQPAWPMPPRGGHNTSAPPILRRFRVISTTLERGNPVFRPSWRANDTLHSGVIRARARVCWPRYQGNFID